MSSEIGRIFSGSAEKGRGKKNEQAGGKPEQGGEWNGSPLAAVPEAGVAGRPQPECGADNSGAPACFFAVPS